MATIPYEYVTEYSNGFDLDLAYPHKTISFRIVFEGDKISIATNTINSFDYDVDISQEYLAIIKRICKSRNKDF